MRCRCCNSPDAHYIRYYDEYYCNECLDVIEETIAEDSFDDLEEEE